MIMPDVPSAHEPVVFRLESRRPLGRKPLADIGETPAWLLEVRAYWASLEATPRLRTEAAPRRGQ